MQGDPPGWKWEHVFCKRTYSKYLGLHKPVSLRLSQLSNSAIVSGKQPGPDVNRTQQITQPCCNEILTKENQSRWQARFGLWSHSLRTPAKDGLLRSATARSTPLHKRALHSLLQPEAAAQRAELRPHPTLLGEAKRFPRVVLQVCIRPAVCSHSPQRCEDAPFTHILTILGIIKFCRTQGCAVVWLCISLVSS